MKRMIVIQYNPNNYVEPIIELIEKGTPVLLVLENEFERLIEKTPVDRRFVNMKLFQVGINNFVTDLCV